MQAKTTLTSLLAKHYQWEAHFEDVVDNPYLDDFYHQMERWSFNLQIYFLNSRFRQILDFREKGNNIIQDRTIYEDAHIFAPNLHEMGLMSSRDFDNYKSLFALMERLVLPPDLTDLPQKLSTQLGKPNTKARSRLRKYNLDRLS